MIGEKVKGIKPCPFCGKNGKGTTYTMKLANDWELSHTCNLNGEQPHWTVNIAIYGKSEEEVIEKWNNRVQE